MACVLSKQPMFSCVLRTADIRRGKIKNSHILEKAELDQGIRDGMEKNTPTSPIYKILSAAAGMHTFKGSKARP